MSTQKPLPKFIQIVTGAKDLGSHDLYALDENGDVWIHVYDHSQWVWRNLGATRQT